MRGCLLVPTSYSTTAGFWLHFPAIGAAWLFVGETRFAPGGGISGLASCFATNPYCAHNFLIVSTGVTV